LENPSHAQPGRFALRACITNFRTTRVDVERVITVVRELAC
jgi:hypothetical protein